METIKFYEPLSTLNYESEHLILFTLRYEDATAQLISNIGGNVTGLDLLNTDFYTGFTVPANHELTKKYAVLEEDDDRAHRSVEEVIFHYPDGNKFYMDIEDSASYVVGIQVIEYMPDGDGED